MLFSNAALNDFHALVNTKQTQTTRHQVYDAEYTSDSVIISTDIPGVSKDELDVSFELMNAIVVRAKNSERSYHFRINVRSQYDVKQTVAKLENGVLTLTAPKAAKNKIEVQ